MVTHGKHTSTLAAQEHTDTVSPAMALRDGQDLTHVVFHQLCQEANASLDHKLVQRRISSACSARWGDLDVCTCVSRVNACQSNGVNCTSKKRQEQNGTHLGSTHTRTFSHTTVSRRWQRVRGSGAMRCEGSVASWIKSEVGRGTPCVRQHRSRATTPPEVSRATCLEREGTARQASTVLSREFLHPT